MKCSTERTGRTPGRKRTHGSRTSASYRLAPELLMALRHGAKCRGVSANELFCHFMAPPAGVEYALAASAPLMLTVAPEPLLLSRNGPTPFQMPDDMYAGLRAQAARLHKSVTALVIETLEEELTEELTAVREQLRSDLRGGGSSLARAS